jgi:murein DD-endopeptidase MepM/ murein hydrolase activator NlpD
MRINRSSAPSGSAPQRGAPQRSAQQKSSGLRSSAPSCVFFSYTIRLHVLISLLLIGILSACQSKEAKTTSTKTKEAVPAMRHGINLHPYQVRSSTVKNGDNLGSILAQCGASATQSLISIERLGMHLDNRKIRAGLPYTWYANDSSGQLAYWVLEPDAYSYLRVDFQSDTPSVERVMRPTTSKMAYKSGRIDGSLYQSMGRSGATQELIANYTKLFDWTVDFFHLQEGDSFRVVHEEVWIDGRPGPTRQVQAAELRHKGKSYYGFVWLTSDGKTQYYNEKGESMKRRYLKAPLDYTRISSGFAKRRFHPVLRINRPHLGIDYAAPTGTPIRAIGDGTVTEAGYKGGNGNFVRIRHNKTHETGYLHMSRIGKGIRRGTRVQQGQVIGYVGSTGLATGPHLCFRFWENGVQVNPARIQTPPSDPLPPAEKQRFMVQRDSLMQRLKGG